MNSAGPVPRMRRPPGSRRDRDQRKHRSSRQRIVAALDERFRVVLRSLRREQNRPRGPDHIQLAMELTLQPGDIIPVCLPNLVPVTVAGRVFARGSVGESNGRTAIKIERIEEGSASYE